jgi:hypothetical protein
MDKNNSDVNPVSFETLKDTRLQIKQSFTDIDIIKNSIKQNYIQYIQQESENFFGLDSFHFQNKAIELEYGNMLNLYHFIDNRIYGDYYKLFLMIHESLTTQLSKAQMYKLKELQHLSNYPPYKDLEPYKIYDFDLIHQIHQDIVLVLSNVKETVTENEVSIKEHQKHLVLGIQIDNYVINQNYMNQRLKMSNELHESYLQVFHNYHDTWLRKYYEKNRLFYKQICHHQESQQQYKIDGENENENTTQTASNPVRDESNPVRDESKPVRDESNPVCDELKPVRDESKPVRDESKPVCDESNTVCDESNTVCDESNTVCDESNTVCGEDNWRHDISTNMISPFTIHHFSTKIVEECMDEALRMNKNVV